MTRSAAKAETVRELGAVAVIADALDPEQVARAVAEAEPEAIVLLVLHDVFDYGCGEVAEVIRSRGARVAALARRGPARRRGRQGAGAGAPPPRRQPGGAGAGELGRGQG
jgi:hypothetical protein